MNPTTTTPDTRDRYQRLSDVVDILAEDQHLTVGALATKGQGDGSLMNAWRREGNNR